MPSKKKTPKALSPPKHSKGILITCDIHEIRRAVSQILNLLNTLLPEEKTSHETTENAEDSFESELLELQNGTPKSSKRFQEFISEVNGNVFIRFTREEDDPLEFVEAYFNRLKETKQTETDKIVRVFPIQASGCPSDEDSLELLDKFIPVLFHENNPLTYEVFITRKHKGSCISHDELNNAITKNVGPPHRPLFHGAQSAILWIHLGRNLYVGYVPNWSELCSCNIPKFLSQ